MALDDAPDVLEYTWRIANFSSLVDPFRSPTLSYLGHTWNLLLYPRGLETSFSLSLFLERIGPFSESSVSVSICFSLLCHGSREPVKRKCEHTFAGDSVEDIGFKRFIDLHNLGAQQYLDDDDSITIFLRCTALPNNDTSIPTVSLVNRASSLISSLNRGTPNSEPNSEAMSPTMPMKPVYAGILNQGATCYMNSLLQSLFHIHSFRRVILENSSDAPVLHAMQRLFYDLMSSPTSASTSKLTKSFGWDSADAFQQHDVQEFSRVLLDRLEDKLEGIPKLFCGTSEMFIECVNVKCKSTRKEKFYDLSLNVQGCNDLHSSLAQYVDEELLSGPNQYQTTEFGRQDAKKGIRLLEAPPILQLQLKRFQYDANTGSMVKINDRFEFPESLDLSKFLGQKQVYNLHSVLVHSGTMMGGHYYAYIRPDGKHWYKFDDNIVTQVDQSVAIAGSFGSSSVGEDTGSYYKLPSKLPSYHGFKRQAVAPSSSSAYMLVYIRQGSDDHRFTLADIPLELSNIFALEDKAESERRAKQELADRQMDIQVLLERDLRGFAGCELGEFSLARTMTVLKKDTPQSIRNRLTEFGVDPQSCVTWYSYPVRMNGTARPQYGFPDSTVFDRKMNRTFFLVESNSEGPKSVVNDIVPGVSAVSTRLIVIKIFDSETSLIRYVTTMSFDRSTTIASVVQSVKDFLSPNMPNSALHDIDFRVYEEVLSARNEIKYLEDQCRSLSDYQISTGDILVLDPSSTTEGLFEAYQAAYDKVNVALVQVDGKPPNDDDVGIMSQVCRSWTLRDIQRHIANVLSLQDPTRLVLYTVTPWARASHDSALTVEDLISLGVSDFTRKRLVSSQKPLKLCYEILDFSAELLATHTNYEVQFIAYDGVEMTETPVLLENTAIVANLLDSYETPNEELVFTVATTGRLLVIPELDSVIIEQVQKARSLCSSAMSEENDVYLRVYSLPVLQTEKVVWVTWLKNDYYSKLYGECFPVLVKPGCSFAELKSAILTKLPDSYTKAMLSKWKFLHYTHRTYRAVTTELCDDAQDVFDLNWDLGNYLAIDKCEGSKSTKLNGSIRIN